MTYSFTVSKAAGKHIEAAYLWYEQQNQGLGIKFIEALDIAFSSVKSDPLLYSFTRNNIRGVLIKGFPYLVLFYVKRSSIKIVAVFHTSRKPKI